MGGIISIVALVHHKHWNSGWFLQHENHLTINLNLGTALRRMWDEVRGEDKELNKIFIMQVFVNIFLKSSIANKKGMT